MSTPDVLVLVGTDHHHFDRLVRWADAWAAARPGVVTLVQHGTSPAPLHAKGVAFVGYEELQDLMAAARVVVCHGGPSTIAEARRPGRFPLVLPRSPVYGEHVDDHQVRFTRRLADEGLVKLVYDEAGLVRWLDAAYADPSSVSLPPGARDERGSSTARFADAITRLMERPGRRPHGR